jgi:hypothetical protein
VVAWANLGGDESVFAAIRWSRELAHRVFSGIQQVEAICVKADSLNDCMACAYMNTNRRDGVGPSRN